MLRFDIPPPQFVNLDHGRVAYRRIGSGPDVLFVHGWPLSSATFRDVAQYLSEGFSCHLIDLPGAGHSEWSADVPVGILEHAQTVVEVCDRLGLQHLALIGHDSGASIARVAAASLSERVVALVLSNTEIPGHRPWQVQVYQRIAALPIGPALFRASLRWRWVQRSALGFGGCFADMAHLDGECFELMIAPLLQDDQRFSAQMRFLRGFDWQVVDGLRDTHRRISAPVLLLWGDADPFFPLAAAQAMVTQFPTPARLQVIAGGKLLHHDEMPELFAQHCQTFLTRAFGETKKSDYSSTTEGAANARAI